MENFLYLKELASIKKSNRFRTRDIFDENLIDLASNDYLGLSTNKSIFIKAGNYCSLLIGYSATAINV